MKFVMNFEHIATAIPTNVSMTLLEGVAYKLGFKDKIIDRVMERNGLMNEEYFYEGVTYVKQF